MTPTVSEELRGDAFAAALRSGIHKVIGDQETLNAINVFPVPDGDTGTNLSLSLGSALETLAAPPDTHVGNLLARIADDLLDGSRGNSGAILAQFFQGLSDAAADLGCFTTATFARAVRLGSDYAHDALAQPKEGTILSVIAAYATSLGECVSRNDGRSFPVVLAGAVDAARSALARTPEQLEALRQAGVVDAGAKGFVDLVEGMTGYLTAGTTIEPGPGNPLPASGRTIETAGASDESGYRYCTECVVNGADIDRRKLREALSALGDSLVLAGTKRKAKIHIHSDDPERVFEAAGDFGEVSAQKGDDMQVQQRSTHDISARFAVITDSAADIPESLLESLDIHLVPLRVQFGERGYLDKVSITPSEFFEKLRSSEEAPTTSQPAPGDFRRQYQFLASHFPDVISISLTGRVSGTLQAAQNAALRVDAPGRVHVVDTRNASLGQGLLTILAAECARAGYDAEKTLAILQQAIPDTVSFAIVKDLTWAVRGGRVPRSRKLVADLLRITPVLRTTADGRVSSGGIIPGRRRPLKRFARYIRKHAPDGELEFLVGHAHSPDDAEFLAAEIEAVIPWARCRGLTSIGTALGVHAGPGALVVGLQRRIDVGTAD